MLNLRDWPRDQRPQNVPWVSGFFCVLCALVALTQGKPLMGAEEGIPRGTRYVVIMLAEPAPGGGAPAKALPLETIQASFDRHVRLPSAPVVFVDVYNSDLISYFEPSYIDAIGPARARLASCRSTKVDDPYRRNLGETQAYLNSDTIEVPDPGDRIRSNFEYEVEHFHCQTDPKPLSITELRSFLLSGALVYSTSGMRGGRDSELFWHAYTLGTEDRLGDGLTHEFSVNAGVWDKYTRQVSALQQHIHRLPVYVDTRALVSYTVFVDGAPLTLQQQQGQPLNLYPGTHFLQVVDPRGRLRSDVFEVPSQGVSKVHLRLGSDKLGPDQKRSMGERSGGWFIPRLDELDELLWLEMTREFFPLPHWVHEGARRLLEDLDLAGVYVIAPPYSRDRGWEDVMVGQLVAGQGIEDLPPRHQNHQNYRRLDELRQGVSRLEPTPGRFTWTAGLGAIHENAASSLEFSARLGRSVGFYPEVGLSLHPFLSDQSRYMSSIWAGVRHAPEQLTSGLTCSVGAGTLVTNVSFGENGQIQLLPILRASVGVEGPVGQGLFDGSGMTKEHALVARLEVATALAPQLNENETFTELGLRLSLRLWHRRTIEALLP